jgi:two-component system, NarL family, response regulator DesR
VKRRLTNREYELLELVARGYTTKKAAAELGISPNTARTHMGRVLLKLEAQTQAHAVAIMFRKQELS